jgi:hypothetical protein
MPTTAEEQLSAYFEHAKVLRTWFVAYGVGAPVLLFTNDRFVAALKASGTAKFAATLFLLGVTFQIFLASLNKAAMWTLYFGSTRESFKAKRRYKFALWLGEAFWIDLIVDLSTMLFFGLATWRVFSIVAT